MALDIKNLKVILVEEQIVLLSSMSNMLKNMGFSESHIHKASNFITFNRLIKTNQYHLIICNYSAKGEVVGRKYQHLYQQCNYFSNECVFMFVTGKLQSKERVQIQDLNPDAIIETPFNYNQFKEIVDESLRKRQAFTTVSYHLMQGNFKQAMNVCNSLSRKNKSWLVDLNKVIIEHYLSVGDSKKALSILNTLYQKNPNEWVLLKMIDLYSSHGGKHAALTLAHEYEALGYPEHHLISEITAYNSLLDSDIERAVEILKQITTRYPYLVDASINLAYLFLASNDFKSAYLNLGRVDPNYVLKEEHDLCIKEFRIALEVVYQLQKGNGESNQRLTNKISKFLQCNGEQVDDPSLTKLLYKVVLDVTSENPVCTSKRLFKIWSNTKLAHRKLMVIALAYYLGFIDEVTQWIKEESELLKDVRNMDAAVAEIMFNMFEQLKCEKMQRIDQASELEKSGRILEPLAIKSREVPSLITHHLDFVNAMIKYQTDSSHNLDLLVPQFKLSSAILIKNLQRQDPMHPKISVIQKIQKIVLSRDTKMATNA